MGRLDVGVQVGQRALVSIRSQTVAIPDPARLVHLQFRRFAGCPCCSLHLRSVARDHDAIVAAGVREVVVFRSPATPLRRHYEDAPFAVIADPGGELYDAFGVGSGARAVLDPRAWAAAARGMAVMWPRLPALPANGAAMLGLPADFLIGSDGRVRACHYGVHADDQWSVDRILGLARLHA